MAEFKEICRQWHRMCAKCQEQYDGCDEGCPMGENDVCGFIRRATNADIEQAEHVIMDWAKANPEPVYPTWAEWLMEHGLIFASSSAYMKHWYVINQSGLEKPIPADIAEKLGIKPKEG